MLDELLPAVWHRTERYANNHIECEHGRLRARLRPMRGLRARREITRPGRGPLTLVWWRSNDQVIGRRALKRDRSARVVVAGHALVQNIRRGHYELAVQTPVNRRVAVAFGDLAMAV